MQKQSDVLDSLIIGIDVGSTTVKATVVNPKNKEILWSDYQRHHTKQAEKVLEFLITIGNEFSHIARENIRVFVTGSGGGPIVEHIGAKFVQEVNAVTMAVEQLHPDVGSVIELGGQDAKIIIFKANEETGDKQALTSMNDKCASGTGATIDKCMIKVGMPMEEVGKLHFDDSKLHHVAAKCGVFAETDIVNLVKSGIPAPEIMCSLADAIVMQNLSVLTRGNTLRHRVLLLGGPNTYLPFLQECWRKRIPTTWEERGYDYPKDMPIEELIFVPENSQYYAAYGAVMYGMHEPAGVGTYTGVEGLKEFIAHGRKAKLGESASIPVAAMTEGGAERVRIGSTMAMVGMNTGCFSIILTSSAVLVITVTSVASEPVPAVVGMAKCGMRGGMQDDFPRRSPIYPPFVSRTTIALAVSMQLPPPREMTKSHASLCSIPSASATY